MGSESAAVFLALTGPFRAVLADYGISCASMIGIGSDGLPLQSWALVILSAADLAPIRADSRVFLMPDLSLDTKVSAMDGSVKAAMLAEFTRRGITTGIVSTADGYRSLIEALGLMHSAAFDVDAFDVAGA
jgi:hypothetical protein